MLDKEQMDRLFGIEQALQGMGLGSLSPEEIRAAMHGGGKGLAPMPRQNMLPQAGFQGNSMFPNQGGGGMLQPGQQPPPLSQPGLNPMGQPMGPSQQTPGWFNQPPPQQQMAQAGGMPGQMGGGMPGMGGMAPRGFTTDIQIGEDGQVNTISLKRAIQKAKQQGQQMGGMLS